MKRLILAAFMAGSLAGCSSMNPLALLTGGGPNVAANTQVARTATQTIGRSEVNEQRMVRPVARSIEQSSAPTQVRSESVGAVHVTNVDPWHIGIMMLLAGFLIPTPAAIAAWIIGLFRRKPVQAE